jgi:hypothetical protein
MLLIGPQLCFAAAWGFARTEAVTGPVIHPPWQLALFRDLQHLGRAPSNDNELGKPAFRSRSATTATGARATQEPAGRQSRSFDMAVLSVKLSTPAPDNRRSIAGTGSRPGHAPLSSVARDDAWGWFAVYLGQYPEGVAVPRQVLRDGGASMSTGPRSSQKLAAYLRSFEELGLIRRDNARDAVIITDPDGLRAGCGDFVGILKIAGGACVTGIVSLPAFTQVRGLIPLSRRGGRNRVRTCDHPLVRRVLYH